MGQIRLGFERVTAGSAARQAELEAKAQGAAVPRRVQAGSAARLAEEAKRAGVDRPRGTATFSLRAQGGRVQRADLPIAPIPTEVPAPGAQQAETADPSQAVTAGSVRPQEAVNNPSHSRAEPAPHGVVRLKTFLRGLFLPEKPPQP